ncbi:MAG: response regulator transcription factor [Chloroflexi bacterium]|nr:response regulator transcription factor [Chloroflexota bacterium]
MNTPITIVVIDDHPLIRHAIKTQVTESENLILVGEGTAGEHLASLVAQHQPDVVILDLNMPQSSLNHNGKPSEPFQALPEVTKLHRQYPETAVIILSEHIVPSLIYNGIKSGIKGYILKSDDFSLSLPEAIATVSKGGLSFSPQIQQKLFAARTDTYPPVLTPRQLEIVQTIAKSPDKSYAQHAANLGIRESSLRNHLTNINKILGAQNLTGCIIRCLQLGIVSLEIVSLETEAYGTN